MIACILKIKSDYQCTSMVFHKSFTTLINVPEDHIRGPSTVLPPRASPLTSGYLFRPANISTSRSVIDIENPL